MKTFLLTKKLNKVDLVKNLKSLGVVANPMTNLPFIRFILPKKYEIMMMLDNRNMWI